MTRVTSLEPLIWRNSSTFLQRITLASNRWNSHASQNYDHLPFLPITANSYASNTICNHNCHITVTYMFWRKSDRATFISVRNMAKRTIKLLFSVTHRNTASFTSADLKANPIQRCLRSGLPKNGEPKSFHSSACGVGKRTSSLTIHQPDRRQSQRTGCTWSRRPT